MLCGKFNLLLQATLAGLSTCMLTESVCGPRIVAGELEHVLPDWHAGELVLHFAYLLRRGRLQAVRAIAGFLLEGLPPLVRYSDVPAPLIVRYGARAVGRIGCTIRLLAPIIAEIEVAMDPMGLVISRLFRLFADSRAN